MKNKVHKQAILGAVLLMGMSVVSAQDAMNDDMMEAKKFMQTAQAFVQSAVGGSGNVFVSIDGDTATLIGVVESITDKKRAEMAALMDMRVSSVNNRIVTSN
ncbi:MAG: hypothetical protein AB8B63_11380 [Granulosicoccus sp.]